MSLADDLVVATLHEIDRGARFHCPHHIAGPVWAYRCFDGWRVGRLVGEPPAWAPLADGTAHPTRRAAVRAYWAAQHAGPCGGRP